MNLLLLASVRWLIGTFTVAQSMNRTGRFIALITFKVPAIALDRHARSELKNHGRMVLLLASLIRLLLELPMPMRFYWLNYIWPATDAYCVWWIWCEYSSSDTCASLTRSHCSKLNGRNGHFTTSRWLALCFGPRRSFSFSSSSPRYVPHDGIS